MYRAWPTSDARLVVLQFVTYFGYMTENYARTVLDDTLAKGGGLFTARTVREWLWEGQDPLLELVAPALASKSVLVGNEVPPPVEKQRTNRLLT
jgi:hypothetical protein